jgi:hypothetical protein
LSPGEKAALKVHRNATFRLANNENVQDISQLYAADAHKPATLLFDGKRKGEHTRKGPKHLRKDVYDGPDSPKLQPVDERLASRYVNVDSTGKGNNENLMKSAKR